MFFHYIFKIIKALLSIDYNIFIYDNIKLGVIYVKRKFNKNK